MSYEAKDIKSLSFKEGVRTRIQMYLGSADQEGTYQAFKEIINNSTDEALCGYGNQIDIEISEKDNSISVRDYGRGVPFLVKPDGTNVLVDVYTKAHTGGKFDDSVYKNSSGLNGIGASCVCLSSSQFIVRSIRNGIEAKAEFTKGDLKEYKETQTKEQNGTYVYFIPDPEVFKDEPIQYSFKRICQDIKNISYLYNNITFNILNIDTKEKQSYCSKNGIKDFVKDNIKEPLHNHIMYGKIEDGNDKMEIAFQWGNGREQSYVFVNGLLCGEGGSPITGAKSAITRTFNSLTGENFSGDVIRGNLFYVINCSVAQPSFANQTKTKINNANLRTMASNCFSEVLKDMAKGYKEEFNLIATYLKKITRAEAAADRVRKQVLEATKDIEKNQKRKVFASDKLKDAEFLGQNSTLLICEGNSALGAMSQARDSSKYGLLAIRGKIINCLANEEEDIYQNEEIKLLLSALNITPGKYDSKKLRYGRLGICSDADSDGAHIGLLTMAALAYLAPEFIKENRLCWLRAPLYVVKNKGKRKYFFTDEEYNKVRGKISGEVTRNKGLGEMSAEVAHESMFNPEFQRLDILTYDDSAIKLLYQLMGKDVTPRKNFLFKNVDFTKISE